jgi:predicted nucleic acid-binding protein
LLAHNRQEAGGERVQAFFEDLGSEILVSAVSLAELARRLRELGASNEEARDTVEGYLDLVDEVVPVDERMAFTAFEVGCAASQRVPLADALIAAAARERGACLVHRDHHMTSIPRALVQQIDLSVDTGSEASF